MNSQPDSAPQPQREFIPRRSWLATPLGRHRFLLFMVAAFAALLVLVPLPLGSNRIWAASLASLWNQLLLMTLTIAWIREPQLLETPFTRPLRYAGILFMAVIAWMIVQMMPGIATELQHPLWADAAKLLQEQGLLAADSKDIGRIALDPSASILSLVRITGYAASFCLALLLAQDSRRANILLGVIIVAGVAYAGYGFAIELSGKNTVLWFEKRAYRGNLTSTFFNRNSYAAYAGLGLLSSSAYVFQRWHKAWRNTTRRFFWRDFLENLAGRELYWIALPLVFMAALILSASRAGFASCMVGLVTLIIGLAINKRASVMRLLTVIGSFAAIGVVTLLFIGPRLVGRLEGNVVNEDLEMRLGVYRLTWEAIQANPWFGYGLGNFDAAFRLYRDPSVIGWFQEAHNEYLEIMMDMGLPAAVLWFTALGIIIWQCARGMVKRRRNGIFPVLALAVTVQEALHSILDFSLQIPAVAITYAALLGMGVAQSRSSSRNESE